MNSQKWTTVVIYAAMLACLVIMPGTQAAQIIGWVFVALVVAHILEFIMVYRLLSSAPGSLLHHFIHTFLFGFMHWLPIKKAQQSET
jgi:uncharacterized protein YhhL (DUF1145 family)